MRDEELVILSKKGFIPGPDENKESFLKRVEISKNIFDNKEDFLKKEGFEGEIVPKPFFSWAKSSLLEFYGASFDELLVIFSDKNLRFFQGAATWIVEADGIKIPVIQLRTALKKGKYLGFYQLDEILTHEASHALRTAFDEPKYEELFAYLPSSSSFRRCLGPIIRKEGEAFGFLALVLFAVGAAFASLFWQSPIAGFFSVLSKFLLFLYIAFWAFRLFFAKLKFRKTYSRLKRMLGKKALGLMFRLKDSEIEKFSRMKEKEIVKFIIYEAEHSFRFRLLYKSFFCENGMEE